MIKPSSCSCGASNPELRYNPANKGVAWKCSACGSPLSQWISHADVPNPLTLPMWDAPLKNKPQSDLF
jgi:hypothetical protein